MLGSALPVTVKATPELYSAPQMIPVLMRVGEAGGGFLLELGLMKWEFKVTGS